MKKITGAKTEFDKSPTDDDVERTIAFALADIEGAAKNIRRMKTEMINTLCTPHAPRFVSPLCDQREVLSKKV